MHVDRKKEAPVTAVNMGVSLLKELQLVIRGRYKYLHAEHERKMCSSHNTQWVSACPTHTLNS